jgi:hypothetical protein
MCSVLGACQLVTAASDERQGSVPASTAEGWSDARAAVASLEVKGRAPKTGYERDEFGPAWSDGVDVAGGHNGCDTRNDVLARALRDVELKPGTHGCVVLSGWLIDPYTGRRLDFLRGASTVDIDHVVALGDAWQKGAQKWTPQKRRDFANDPSNLLAVSASANRAKGQGDAATWLPPRTGFRCTYVSRQITVKVKYRLWVTAAERDAFVRVLDQCLATSGNG